MSAVTRDLLSLVMENPPPVEVIDGWSDADRHAVEDWVGREVYYASDNIIKRLPAPSIIRPWLSKSGDARGSNEDVG